eukprot:gene3920-4463_t
MDQKLSMLDSPVTNSDLQDWKRDAINRAQVSDQVVINMDFGGYQEYLLIAMTLKHLEEVPPVEKVAIESGNFHLFAIKTIKLCCIAKPVPKLVERFVKLNNDLLAESLHSIEDEVDELSFKILSVYQQRVEAFFYSNLHISHNIGKLTVGELWQKFPPCDYEAVNSARFPWVDQHSTIEIERRGNVVERGNEELHFLLFQHGNAGNYTRSLWVVPKGESFVAHQGLLIVLDQVEKGSRWFGKVLSSEEVDLCLDVEGIHDDIDFDNVDSEDDSTPLDEQDDIDENSLTVKEDLLKTLNRKYNIAYTQQEGKFPLDICQSLFEGRNGSNTWMFINLLFANTFCRLCFVADGASQLSDSKVSLIENSIRNGNLLYDRFVEASGTSQLPNIDDACEFIIREEIFACVESLHDIEVSDGDDIGQCIDKLRNSSNAQCPDVPSAHLPPDQTNNGAHGPTCDVIDDQQDMVLGDQLLPASYENFGTLSSDSSDSDVSMQLHNAAKSFGSRSTSSLEKESFYSASPQANTKLLQQGLSLIAEDEIEISEAINTGPNANVYKATFKGTNCAAKAYKGVSFSAVCKEYHILMLLSSHVAVPHAFGVVNERVPKLILTSYSDTHVRLSSMRYTSCKQLGHLVVSLLEAVLHLQSRGILHNNISPSNILVEPSSGSAILCGFSKASYGEGYFLNKVGLRSRFGEVCSLPPEVKAGKEPLSLESEVFCMGYSLMGHVKIAKKVVSDISAYVRRLTHDCTRPAGKERPGIEHLEASVAHLNRLLE